MSPLDALGRLSGDARAVAEEVISAFFSRCEVGALSPTQSFIVAVIYAGRGRVVSRDTLLALQMARRGRELSGEGVIEQHLHKLRRAEPGVGAQIAASYGRGWRWIGDRAPQAYAAGPARKW